jgi:hypothetical protein
MKIKNLITMIAVVLIATLAGFLQAQTDTLENVICKERGHLLTGGYGVTAMWCPPRTIDLEDRTITIYWDQNHKHGYCERCGKEIWEPVQAEPDTVIIWKRESKNSR